LLEIQTTQVRMPFISSAEYTYAYANAQQVATGAGTSSNNPAVNAIAVINGGSSSNGWYWIKTSRMPVARQVYCNLTDVGGGWMCVSYGGTKQSVTTVQRGQFYPSAWSGDAGVLSGQFAVDAMDLWYNNGVNQCSNMLRLATNTINDTPTVANSYIAHQIIYTSNAARISTTASGVQGTGVLDPSAVLIPTTWSSIKGYTLMSQYNTNAPSDWMYNTGANFFWNPVLPTDSSNTIRTGSGLGIGGWMLTTNRDSWGFSNVASNASSSGNTFTGNTLAVFVR
jgi:hypothetical protein